MNLGPHRDKKIMINSLISKREKNMKEDGLKLVLLTIVAILLAGCGTTGDKQRQQTSSRLESRTVSRAPASAPAVSQGLAEDTEFSAAALDDPEGPLSVRTVYFDYDSSAVREEFRETVTAHASYLAANASASVTLQGHADERGTREYNRALGEARALSVRSQLVLLGATAEQIKTVSYGEERPVAEGHDEKSYAVNRRVEILY